MSDTGGAGKAGGLLFAVVAIIIAFLVLRAIAGFVRFAVGAVILLAVISLVMKVMDRR